MRSEEKSMKNSIDRMIFVGVSVLLQVVLEARNPAAGSIEIISICAGGLDSAYDIAAERIFRLHFFVYQCFDLVFGAVSL